MQGSRQLSEDQRTVIFRRYSWWLADGKLEAESPIAALMQEFTVGRQYPKRLYDKVMKHGNVADRVRIGRPSDFSPRCWEQMRAIIREHRERQRTASCSTISASLKKKRGSGVRTPTAMTISRAKKTLGYRRHMVQRKPKLSTTLWEQRLHMAKEEVCASDTTYIKKNARTVFGDEKWFSEEKLSHASFEAAADSPVRANIRFKAKDAETRTQLVKIMFLLVVTSTMPIGSYELDFKSYNAKHKVKTKSGKPAVGITG